MIAILGAGIAGISAGYHLKTNGIDSIVYEKKIEWGGLCNNLKIGNEFRFDYFVHLSFTSSEVVKEIFKSCKFISHQPKASNYYKGNWIKHPIQNNLSPLSTTEKLNILMDFFNKPQGNIPKNYYEWLVLQFGEYFTINFPGIYTKKYWTLSAEELTTDWLGNRFSLPSFEKILKGAFEEQDENFFYANEMRYPERGGYKSFLNSMAEITNIQTNKNVLL